MHKYVPTRLSWLFCLLCCCSITIAQTGLEADIQVGDNKMKPIANVEVMLMEQTTRDVKKALTNTEGKAHFSLTTGIRWNIYIAGNLQPKEIIEVPQGNSYGEQSFYFTYDPALDKRLQQQSFERKGLQEIKVKPDNIGETVAHGFFITNITVTNTSKEVQANKKVAIVCLAQKKMYTAFTNAEGVARFQLPISNQYDIDVEEQLNAGFIDNAGREGVTNFKTIVYDSYDLVETKSNDTITQKIKLPAEGKNSRALFRIKMKRSNGKVFNENVFLDEIHGNTVYRSKTDKNGEAFFILPFGKKYMVHFNYERDVDVADFTDARGSAEGFLEITYQPKAELEFPEKFIPKVGELVLIDFEYYHKTPYPKPLDTSKPHVFLRWGNNKVNKNSKESVLEIGLNTMFVSNTNRLPANISFVMDRSGSMAGHERIESLKEGFANLIQKLHPEDIISIVLFDDNMELLLPAQKVGYDKNKVINLIKNIQPQGGTNMLEAMKTGYEQVMQHYQQHAINAVVLLTDGFDSNPVDVLIRAQQPYNDRVICMGIGVGKDYNYSLMKDLVSKGGGLLSHAEGKDLVDLFSNKLLQLATPVIKDASIEIAPHQPIVCRKIYGANKVQLNANSIKASLPDLYTGMEKPLLAYFTHNVPGATIGWSPVNIVLRYTNPSTGKQETVSTSINLSWDNTVSTTLKPLVIDEEQKKMYAVAFANECLTNMAMAFEKGNIVEAKKQLLAGLEKLNGLYPSTTDPDILELLNKMKRYQIAFKNLDYKKEREK